MASSHQIQMQLYKYFGQNKFLHSWDSNLQPCPLLTYLMLLNGFIVSLQNQQ